MADTSPPPKPSWKRSLFWTILAAAGVLLVLCAGAWGMHKYLLDTWATYTSLAALILGVGGVFVLVGLASDATQEAANAVGLAAVGLGSIMLAYKEVAASFGKPEPASEGSNQPVVGDHLFVKTTVILFAAFAFMLWLVQFISTRPEDSGLTKAFALGIAGIFLSTSLLVIGLSTHTGPLFMFGWFVLLSSSVAMVIAARKRRNNRTDADNRDRPALT